MQRTLLDYIRKNFFSLLTVFLGIVALVLTEFNFLPPGTIGSATLALVIVLATSQLVDNARKLDKIEKTITDGFQGAITSLGGVSVVQLVDPEKGFLYLANKVKNSESRLDHVSLSPQVPRNCSAAEEWEKAIEKALLSKRIHYRYVCAFCDQARAKRVEKHLLNPKIDKYHVGFYQTKPDSAPMPNFLVIDEDEVVAMFPVVFGCPEVWVSIKHPDLVKMFSGYFQRLWSDSVKLSSKDITDGIFDSLTMSKPDKAI